MQENTAEPIDPESEESPTYDVPTENDKELLSFVVDHTDK